ncbi:hypothetical protein [Aeromicrobium wangtongii]|uniref:Universal stress protein family protein n=1 Tax=Aeromicrobium wangtongii TaxID=2969247 RepID=A0ABY5MAJ7_9ACTN|nr:hypothetical protein [Aeromicrobium wangtongii]MCD9199739.1 hypothetical protein [Aeromicrobium wangtongii]UUP14088.1 hypothetical protein NQV15_01905 [Aeromicrobium wangtongii]
MPSRRPVMGVVPLGAVDDRARTALSTAWSMMSGNRLIAVHVNDGPEDERDFIRRWELWEPGIPLVLLAHLPCDGEPVSVSIADYLTRRHRAYQTMVVITEHDPAGPIGRRPAHPTRGDALEAALLPLPHVVVCRQRLVAPDPGGVRG